MHLKRWFGIGTIFSPATVRKSRIGTSIVHVKGVLEKQRQEKLRSSIGRAVNC